MTSSEKDFAWKKWDNPLFWIFLPSLDWELVEYLHLKVKEFTVSSVDDVGCGVRICHIDEIHVMFGWIPPLLHIHHFYIQNCPELHCENGGFGSTVSGQNKRTGSHEDV